MNGNDTLGLESLGLDNGPPAREQDQIETTPETLDFQKTNLNKAMKGQANANFRKHKTPFSEAPGGVPISTPSNPPLPRRSRRRRKGSSDKHGESFVQSKEITGWKSNPHFATVNEGPPQSQSVHVPAWRSRTWRHQNQVRNQQRSTDTPGDETPAFVDDDQIDKAHVHENYQSHASVPQKSFISAALPTRPKSLQPSKVSQTKNFSTSSKNKHNFKSSNRGRGDPLIELPAPQPTDEYLQQAARPPSASLNPQRLLIILDLNGTLLFRHVGSREYKPRPLVEHLLKYCFTNHSILVWSSAMPRNVKAVCAKLFSPDQHALLLGIWARDTLGIPEKQYHERVQVYKRLETVWNDLAIQQAHPNYDQGERWGQHNTILIDDSATKAAAQPYNHLEIPEFDMAGGKQEPKTMKKAVLPQVRTMLEEARGHSDVSSFVRAKGLEMGGRWTIESASEGG